MPSLLIPYRTCMVPTPVLSLSVTTREGKAKCICWLEAITSDALQQEPRITNLKLCARRDCKTTDTILDGREKRRSDEFTRKKRRNDEFTPPQQTEKQMHCKKLIHVRIHDHVPKETAP